jgi:putative DNA primase/helicase
VWKSIRANGRITTGTLYHEAQKRGFKLNGEHSPSVATPENQVQRQREIEQADADDLKHRAVARKCAEQIWREANPESGNHKYLRDKGVNAYGIRTDGERLIVPMRDTEGTLHSLQFIPPDGRKKQFLMDGLVKGCYHAIGKANGVLCICEGYATGVSIHEAAGHAVAVAFHAGNLAPVAGALQEKYPDLRLVICADNDIKPNDRNIGLEEATKAAQAVNGFIAVPERDGQKCDFNDLARLKGPHAVQHVIQGASPPTMSGLSGSNQAHYGNSHSCPDEDTWPQPQSIVAELSPVEPLPVAIIPEPYRAWIADVSVRMQTPPDFLATAAIVVTATVIGTACTIKPKRRDDWQVIPNLWGGAIGRPSVLLKTPAMKEALNPLARLELEAKQLYDAEQQRYDADVEMHKAKREAMKGRMKQAVKKGGSDIDDLKFEFSTLTPLNVPVWQRFKTNDATIEKCNELMRDNPRGLLLFRDELVGLLAGWEKPGHESDRAYFLEGWNGNQGHTDDRIGRGTIYAENVCISLYGGIQPAKLQSYLYQCMRGLQNGGLMQRLQLAVYPDEPKSWQLIDRYPDTKAKHRAYKIIERLSKADFTDYGANLDEGDKFPPLRFTDDAQALFYE